MEPVFLTVMAKDVITPCDKKTDAIAVFWRHSHSPAYFYSG
jgi:hypothetical protein